MDVVTAAPEDREVDHSPREDNEEPVQGSSVLRQIKQRRRAYKVDRRKNLAMPGYGDTLYGRFKPVDIEDLRDTGKMVDKLDRKKSRRAEYLGATDVLIDALEMFVALDPENPMADVDGFVPLHEYPEIEADLPIGFDAEILKFLDLPEAKRTREIVWSVLPEPLTIMNVYADLMEWQAEVDSDADDDASGESQGAR